MTNNMGWVKIILPVLGCPHITVIIMKIKRKQIISRIYIIVYKIINLLRGWGWGGVIREDITVLKPKIPPKKKKYKKK